MSSWACFFVYVFWNESEWNRDDENDSGHSAPGMRMSGIGFAMKKGTCPQRIPVILILEWFANKRALRLHSCELL